jgi:hypothetical protein
MSRSATLAALLLGAAGVAVASTALPADGRSIAVSSAPPVLLAAEVVDSAAAGRTVSLAGVTIDGDIDLRPVGTLTGPFRCRGCDVTGSVHATDVVFERAFEISDSTVSGSVDLGGAVFRDRFSFEGTRVAGRAGAHASRFLGDASFVDARFLGEADLGGASFEEGADFRLADFSGSTEFRGAQFGFSSASRGRTGVRRDLHRSGSSTVIPPQQR